MDEMARAFGGRGNQKKTSPELIRYIQDLYRERHLLSPNFREAIIGKVRDVFAVNLSESLVYSIYKPVINEEKNRSGQNQPNLTIAEHPAPNLSTENATDVQAWSGSGRLDNERFLPESGVLLQHAGLVLLMFWLCGLSGIERQLVCQLLLGAQNIEQTRTICYESLRYFCSELIVQQQEQRDRLTEAATLANLLAVYKHNASLLTDGPDKGRIFYFDVHTKECSRKVKLISYHV